MHFIDRNNKIITFMHNFKLVSKYSTLHNVVFMFKIYCDELFF